MFHIVCTGICIFFLVLGFVDFLRTCIFLFLRSRGSNCTTVVVPIKGNDERAEFMLRSAAAKILWTNSADKSRLICLDCGMDYETRRICTLICNDYDFADIYDLEDFESNIS